jgi:hypothetical protein
VFQKKFFFVWSVCLLVLAGNALAIHWDGGAGAGDPNWSAALNWCPNVVPISSDWVAAINVPGYGPTIDNPGAVAANVQVGTWGYDGELTVTSTGALTVNAENDPFGDFIIAYNAGHTGVVYNEGDIDVGGWMYVGHNGNGLLEMNGGTIDIVGNLSIGNSGPTSVGHINFHGGTVTTEGLILSGSGSCTANFTEGVLIAKGADVEGINFLIGQGYWTAYSGGGDVMVDDGNINPGYVTVWAEPGPAQWDGNAGAGNPNWNVATNWSIDSVPTGTVDVHAVVYPVPGYGPTIANLGAVARTVKVSSCWGWDGELTVTPSGSLTVVNSGGDGEGDLIIAYNAENTGVLDNEGAIIVGGCMYVGFNGDGLLNMDGGTIDINDTLDIAGYSGTGHINFHGGVVTAENFDLSLDGSSTADFTEGVLIVSGNHTDDIEWLAGACLFTAYGGTGTVMYDYGSTNPGCTTVWGNDEQNGKFYWDGGAGPSDPNWNVATNWNTDSVPTSTDGIIAIVLPGYGPTIANPGAVVGNVQVGGTCCGWDGELTVTSSGTLTDSGDFVIAYNEGQTGVVYNEGDIDVGGYMYVGLYGNGMLNMNGGTIDIADILNIGNSGSTSVGHINFHGGVVTAGDLSVNGSGSCTADFTEGVLLAHSADVGGINWLISQGYWTAYGGNGIVMVDNGNINPGYVTVWGEPTTGYWDGDAGPGDPNWNVAANWNTDSVPSSADGVAAIVFPGYGPTINNPGAVAGNVQVGTGGLDGELTVTPSGALTDSGDFVIAYNDGETGAVYNEGDIDVSGWMYVGLYGDGMLNMDGGTIDVAGTFCIGTLYDGTQIGPGHVNFHSGTVTAGSLGLNNTGSCTANFTEGVLIASGNHTGSIGGLASAGFFTAYGGTGTVTYDYGSTNPGSTTVQGVPGGSNGIPEGCLNGVNWDAAYGWAYDKDVVPNPIEVHFYTDGDSIDGNFAGMSLADLYNEDIGGNYGYAHSLPDSFHDGYSHSVYSYAINEGQGNTNPMLIGSPRIHLGEKNEVWMTHFVPWQLASSNQWELVKHNLGALELYIEYLGYAGQPEVTNLVNTLKQYDIKIAVECAGLFDWYAIDGDQAGELSFAFEYGIVEKILNAGGTVDYLNMDGPIRRMVYPDSVEAGYHTVDSACDELVDCMQLWRQHIPNIKFCVLTNFTSWGWKGGPAYYNCGFSPGSQCYGDYYEVIQKIIQKTNAAGIPINSVTVDNPYDYAIGEQGTNQPGVIAGIDWMGRIYDLEKHVEDQNIEFNLIFNSARGALTSNQLFYEESLDFITEYHAIGGTPTRYIMQSWFEYPNADSVLPEDTDYTMTNLVANSFYRALPVVDTIGSPVGEFESCASAQAKGWAMDHNDKTAALQIHFYKDGPAGYGTFVGSVTANEYCSDVGNHGFTWNIPPNCQGHRLYAHAINVGAGDDVLLFGTPKKYCRVDFEDFAMFAQQWLSTGSNLAADLDGDNDVDFADLSCFLDNWLFDCPVDWRL